MAGAYFGYRNLFDGWTLNIDGGPGTDNQPLAGFPLANMQARQLSRVSRITNLDTVSGNPLFIPFDAPAPFDANLVMVFGSAPTSITLTIGASNHTFPVFYSSDAAEIDLPRFSWLLIPPAYRTGIERVTLEYGMVFPPAYVEIGRVYVANALIVPDGVDVGWSLDVDDAGTVDASEGRQWYEERGKRTRRLGFAVSLRESTAVFGFAEGATSASDVPSFQAMQMLAGATGEVVVIPRSGTELLVRRLAVYGHLERPLEIRNRSGLHFDVSGRVIEER